MIWWHEHNGYSYGINGLQYTNKHGMKDLGYVDQIKKANCACYS